MVVDDPAGGEEGKEQSDGTGIIPGGLVKKSLLFSKFS